MTWEASVTVQPIQKLGTKDECTEWCQYMLGKEVWVIDPDNGNICVGIIKGTRASLVT